MKFGLNVRSCAEKDITQATSWYEKEYTGLGRRFLVSLDATFQSIKRNPNLHPKVYKNFHRALLPRFPYSVFYTIEKDIITIFAVYHEKRDPESWKTRGE